MSRSAHVTSLEALGAFKAILCEFRIDVQKALCSIEHDVRRASEWLEERRQFWHKEVRRRQEDVARAKAELQQRRYANRDGRGLGSTDQELALAKAQESLREAEVKVERCRRWEPLLSQEVLEYEGQGRQLSSLMDAELPNAVALLQRKIDALESYVRLMAPAGDSAATPPKPIP
jgi:hypothetical protein